MKDKERAGELDQYLQLLTLFGDERGWDWRRDGGFWAHVEAGTGKNLFSAVGIGARDCTLRMRKRPLSLRQAVRWGEQHIFLTAIQPGEDRGHLLVRGALVEITHCVHHETGLFFPAVMTEKYLGHEQREPMAVNTLRHVLVTPKEIVMDPGDRVEIYGVLWPIQTVHTLDPFKNEYEIQREADL